MARGEGRERAEHFSLAERVGSHCLMPICESCKSMRVLSVGSPGRGGGGALLHHVL